METLTPQEKRKRTILARFGSFSVIGKKAAATNKERYGEDFYVKQGSKGGKNGTTGGFHNRELASRAGKIGGSISKRRPKQDEDRQ